MVNDVKVVLHKSKRKNGEYPIMLRLATGKTYKFITLGMTIPEKSWDAKKGEPKKSYPLYQELIVVINNARLSASKQVLNNTATDGREVLEQAVQKSVDKVGVLAYFDQTIKRLRTENRHGYAEVFYSTKLSLLRMKRGRRSEFQFSEMTPQFLREWESVMKHEENKLGTISVYFRTFRVLMGYARLEKVTNVNPFQGEHKFNMAPYSNVKTQKRAIDKESVTAIQQYPAELDSVEFHVQQFFMFSFYTKGMNFIDIAYLKATDVKGKYLEYQRRKTGMWQRVYLLEPAWEIWNYYVRTMKPGQQTVFWFILGPQHKTAQQQSDRLKKVLFQTNKTLRSIASKLGITQYLTTYVARHSFASILKVQGVPTDQISELLGHDSVETTRIYLQSFEQGVLDEAVKKLL